MKTVTKVLTLMLAIAMLLTAAASAEEHPVPAILQAVSNGEQMDRFRFPRYSRGRM